MARYDYLKKIDMPSLSKHGCILLELSVLGRVGGGRLWWQKYHLAGGRKMEFYTFSKNFPKSLHKNAIKGCLLNWGGVSKILDFQDIAYKEQWQKNHQIPRISTHVSKP